MNYIFLKLKKTDVKKKNQIFNSNHTLIHFIGFFYY